MLSKLTVIFSGLCVLLFGYLWYMGEEVPAWQAFFWCFIVFINDLEEYFGYE